MIDVLAIKERQKPSPFAPPLPGDFSYDRVGEADPAIVVTDPSLSLYCLEPDARRALFVQLPEGMDITEVPFIFMAQYEHAQGLYAVPYDTLHRLAGGIDLSRRLLFIHSTGRAGSTLLSKAFGAIDDVTSLSEPDVYSQAVMLRFAGGSDEEIRDLLASATKILFNPAVAPGSGLCVVKTRSQAIEVVDLLSAAFPSARNLFLYRDLAPYMRSATRAFRFDEIPPPVVPDVVAAIATWIPILAQELGHRADVSGFEISGFLWLSAMHGYARLRAAEIPILPVRYEDLVRDPSGNLDAIFTYLDLPADRVEDALQAFERDSQAGSFLSREEVGYRSDSISAEQWLLIRALLQRYPLPPDTIPSESMTLP